MSKVKCRVCEHSDDKKCEVKKSSVAQNKPRRCDYFEHDATKVKVKNKIKTVYHPWHFRDKKAYKEYLKNQEEQTAQVQGVKTSGPDSLARFRSSATSTME